MLFPRLRLAALLALTGALACSSPTSNPPAGFCASIYTPALNLTVVDSVSGVPLAGSATGAFVVDTFPADTLYHGGTAADSLMFGGPVPGTYSVTVTRAGYQPWVRTGIPVTASGVCSELNTVNIRARLQQAP